MTDEYLDTCKMLTQVMQTHHLRHVVSSDIMVKHFFCTSYNWNPPALVAQQRRECMRLLHQLRR